MLHLFLVIVIVVDVTLCSCYEKSMSHSLCQCCHPCQNKSCKHVKVSNHSWMSLYFTYPHGGDAIKRQITESHHNWSHRVRHDSTRSILSKAYWDSEFSSWPSSRSSPLFKKLVPLTNHCKSRFEVAFVDMSVEQIGVCGFWHLKFLITCVFWSMNGQRKHSVCSSLNPCSWGGKPTRILFGDNLAVAWIGVRQTMCTADMWLSFSTLCHPFLCWSFPFGVFSYVSSISSKYASIYVGLVSAWLVLDLWHSTAHCIQLVSSLEFMWQH